MFSWEILLYKMYDMHDTDTLDRITTNRIRRKGYWHLSFLVTKKEKRRI